MKEKIKQTRDRIVDSTRNTLDFLKEHPKEIIMLIGLGGGVYTINKSAPKTYATQIKAQNVSWNGSDYDYFSAPILYMITGQNFFEKIVFPEDIKWIEGMTNPNLTIWTQEPNDSNQIATSRKPLHNRGWAAYLGVIGKIKGPAISNDIEVLVEDANGLEHRKLIGYDSSDANTVHELDKYNWNIITLPDLQNKENEVYAIWMFATPPNLPGDSAGPNDAGKFEIGKLDGQNDYFDIKTIGLQWLQTTEEGENYSEGDLNFDRIVNFEDFAIPAKNWWKTEDGNSISKVMDSSFNRYEQTLQEANIKRFYGDKVRKVTVLRIARALNQNTNHYAGLIPEIAENNRYQSENKPTLKQMLALSQNNHNNHLPKYETIDNKLPTNNHRVFLAAMNGKRLYKRPAA